jgi:hypothetical protein
MPAEHRPVKVCSCVARVEWRASWTGPNFQHGSMRRSFTRNGLSATLGRSSTGRRSV